MYFKCEHELQPVCTPAAPGMKGTVWLSRTPCTSLENRRRNRSLWHTDCLMGLWRRSVTLRHTWRVLVVNLLFIFLVNVFSLFIFVVSRHSVWIGHIKVDRWQTYTFGKQRRSTFVSAASTNAKFTYSGQYMTITNWFEGMGQWK